MRLVARILYPVVTCIAVLAARSAATDTGDQSRALPGHLEQSPAEPLTGSYTVTKG